MDLKQEIMDFITSNFDNYTFQRFCDQTENNFNTIESFLQHNRNCIENLNDDDITFIFHLKNKINQRDIILVDEENMDIEWAAYSIYFNLDGKLVIMHPR